MSIFLYADLNLLPSNCIHKLLVLKYLKVLTDLKSSTCSFGTWAISSNRSLSSYWISVPPYKSYQHSFFRFLLFGPKIKVSHWLFKSNQQIIFWKIFRTLTSALVLSVTSMRNSTFAVLSGPSSNFSTLRSTVAPKLSMLEMKQYSRPCKLKRYLNKRIDTCMENGF